MKAFKLAVAGKVDKLLDALGDSGGEEGEDGNSEADDAAYKWLQVAADFGHKKAREMADDMLESSSLRYDDGGMVVGLIHLELGQAYLKGEAPFPVDHAKATYHLALAKESDVHRSTDVAKGFDAYRRKLTSDAREIFDRHFAPKPARKEGAKQAKRKAKTPR